MKTILLRLMLGLLPVPHLLAQVIAPDGLVGGKGLGDWNAEYWRWLLTIPTNQSPALDPDGRWAHVAQPDGSVFFLAKGYNQTRVGARAFTVPEGKHLFAPLITTFATSLDEDPPYTPEQLREFILSQVPLISGLFISIDGVQVPDLFSYRAASAFFAIDFLDPNNLWSVGRAAPFTGYVDPCLADGYAVLIEPLPPGVHVVRFGGTVAPPVNILFDFTDTITVVPIPLPERVQTLIGLVQSSGLPGSRQHPLLVSLQAAQASFEAGNHGAAANQVQAFLNKVRAQVAPGNAQLAALFTEAAQELMDRARSQ